MARPADAPRGRARDPRAAVGRARARLRAAADRRRDVWRWIVARARLRRLVRPRAPQPRAGKEAPFATVDARTAAVVGVDALPVPAPRAPRRSRSGGRGSSRRRGGRARTSRRSCSCSRHAFEDLGCLRVEFKTHASNERRAARWPRCPRSSRASTASTWRSPVWASATRPTTRSSTTTGPRCGRTWRGGWRPMPRRDDIHKILILGSGPIVIGQAAEFDYSGVQACKVLREEGYEVVLVNSNPATIMTDPEFADRTYVEPLLPGPVAPGHRAREARRAAADARRPDRAQPRQDARRGRHARGPRRRADRRRPRRDPPRRGPRPVPRDDDRGRPARPQERDLDLRGDLARRSSTPARRSRRSGFPCIVRPAFTLGGRGRRHRLRRRRSSTASSPAGWRPRRSARSCSRSRCSAGASSSSR